MTLFWIIVIGGVCWLVSLYVWPFKPCGACGSSGRNKGSTRRRFGTCRRCGGSRQRQRFGSRFVHHSVLSIAAERRKARERRARKRGEL
jgi:hypothetical protein